MSNLLRKLSDIRDVVRLKLNADEGESASICVVLIRYLKYVNLKLLNLYIFYFLFSSICVVLIWTLEFGPVLSRGNVGTVNCVTKLGYD